MNPITPSRSHTTNLIISQRAMQGVSRHVMPEYGSIRLGLGPSVTSEATADAAEPVEMRIRRLVSENPVIILSRPSCYMCHVMKSLLSAVGVHPRVIELEEVDTAADAAVRARKGKEESGVSGGGACASPSPALYIGGACVGGLESVMALHLSNKLVPKLVEVGAVRKDLVGSY